MTTEKEIEQKLINKLQDLKYTYREDICDRFTLEDNFRQKFNELNEVNLTDGEFSRLLSEITSADVFKNAHKLRETDTFEREDGTPLHYSLVDTTDWCKNTFEFTNQLRINTDNSHHRYDVVLLMNGVPVVQIELKSLTINPRRAMEQIVKYKADRGNGYTKTLMCFIQLFIVSNKINTYYFANNNDKHFQFNAEERFLPIYQFADRSNKKISELGQFTKAFLEKCTLGETISRYMVLVENEEQLLMMRPYQVYAVKAIMDSIHQNSNNGYIWHTTGSGKTLTSFKASTLLKDEEKVEKCLFVVDRKDLDRQTRLEFNRFQPNCVEENTNTWTLVQKLLSDNRADKVIVTTIQKLGLALSGNNKKEYKEKLKPLSDKRIVFIFDECHRSQFGKNHKAIKDFFPKAQMFGFTGTPIFEANATQFQVKGEEASKKITQDLFENELHTYTITHAINDKNVLGFRVEHYGQNKGKNASMKSPNKEAIANEVIEVSSGGTHHKPRRKDIVKAIIDKHDRATQKRKFNALFATSSINNAIEYYSLFKEIQDEKEKKSEDFHRLNIACVFSPPAEGDQAKDIRQIQEDLVQEYEDNKQEPEKKKKALDKIIKDYNSNYGTNHSISEFDAYYQDIQKRIKDHQYSKQDWSHKNKIDITIVVDMLLTGFDSKYLNTLYVDKNLKHHGLIQAFSRTNRVLNRNKPHGNIVDFCSLEDAVTEAIVMFSGENDKERAKEIWLVKKASDRIKQYEEAVQKLNDCMGRFELKNDPSEVANVKGTNARNEIIRTFKEVQRERIQLDQYTDLTPKQEDEIGKIMDEDTYQGFRMGILELVKQQQSKKDDAPAEDEQEEADLVLFSSYEIDYDYIMAQIANISQQTSYKQEVTRPKLINLIKSDSSFIGTSESLVEYIKGLSYDEPRTEDQIRKGYEDFKVKRDANEVKTIADDHGLNFDALQNFIDETLQNEAFDDDRLTECLPPELGWKERKEKKEALMKDLRPLLEHRSPGLGISGLNIYES
ncbi:MAG: type I restriction endonuclease subunit R [Candidatus Oxydemutatoraceae bacterium WSBS_2016_MAG_OTU14]